MTEPVRWSRPHAKQKKRSATTQDVRNSSWALASTGEGKAFIERSRDGASVSFRVGPSVFKDQAKLSFDYVPEKMLHREAQMQRLFSYFRPIVEAGVSSNAFLYGPV